MVAFLALAVFQRGPLSNQTPETRRLGLARAAFFKSVFKASERHEETDYVGYRSMLLADHTIMYWPLGRADEVVFKYGSAGHYLLTHWRAQKTGPQRVFQIAFVPGKRAFPYGGTIAKILGGVQATVPKRYAKPLKALLQTRQAYATYEESAALGVYYCEVRREDGSDWPGENVELEDVPCQANTRIDRDGFAITEEELRLLALPKKH